MYLCGSKKIIKPHRHIDYHAKISEYIIQLKKHVNRNS